MNTAAWCEEGCACRAGIWDPGFGMSPPLLNDKVVPLCPDYANTGIDGGHLCSSWESVIWAPWLGRE